MRGNGDRMSLSGGGWPFVNKLIETGMIKFIVDERNLNNSVTYKRLQRY